jgi:hypothetical protein
VTARYNGKTTVKKGASKPSGEPAKTPPPKEIQTPYSKAKAAGGSATLGGGIGNTT